jgi:ATP phosphoribosyltransferase
MFEKANLKPEEIASLELRALYEKQGYRKFKMNKFEEYSLYANNRDFIAGDKVLTFTDLDGRLMALKPDVTLSIIKNTETRKGKVEKFYYNENVYRENKNSTTFMEIPQIGLECIGEIAFGDIAEVLGLAAETLNTLEDNYVLTVSNMAFVEELLGTLELTAEEYKHIIKLIRNKNVDGIRKVAAKAGVSDEDIKLIEAVPNLYGSFPEVIEEAGKYAVTDGMKKALSDLGDIYELVAEEEDPAWLQLDLSMINDIDYYNGIIFKGYIEGIAAHVLGGGQYDRAMKLFAKQGGGIGFALYLNEIARMDDDDTAEEDMLTIALPKGRLGDQVYETLEAAGYECPAYKEDNRKLVVENREKNVRYVLVKPSDVAVYVEHKAADVGIVGKDILLENEPDVFELKDLGIGKCRMCVAARKGFEDDTWKTLRVATKFVNVAKKHYQELNRDIEIIKLNGSIELGPILGLSDVIVDIVETGSTIRENDLEIVEEFKDISARLICNKASYRFKNEEIQKIVEAL